MQRLRHQVEKKTLFLFLSRQRNLDASLFVILHQTFMTSGHVSFTKFDKLSACIFFSLVWLSFSSRSALLAFFTSRWRCWDSRPARSEHLVVFSPVGESDVLTLCVQLHFPPASGWHRFGCSHDYDGRERDGECFSSKGKSSPIGTARKNVTSPNSSNSILLGFVRRLNHPWSLESEPSTHLLSIAISW